MHCHQQIVIPWDPNNLCHCCFFRAYHSKHESHGIERSSPRWCWFSLSSDRDLVFVSLRNTSRHLDSCHPAPRVILRWLSDPEQEVDKNRLHHTKQVGADGPYSGNDMLSRTQLQLSLDSGNTNCALNQATCLGVRKHRIWRPSLLDCGLHLHDALLFVALQRQPPNAARAKSLIYARICCTACGEAIFRSARSPTVKDLWSVTRLLQFSSQSLEMAEILQIRGNDAVDRSYIVL